MSKPRILVVEDVASLALVYAAQMREAGYHAEIADSGQAARAILATGVRLDAMLLDLQLPDCDGLELLDSPAVKERGLAVVVITSDGSLARAVQAMRLGAYDFMVKPVAAERLRTTLRNAVERSVLSREVAQARRTSVLQEFHGFIGSCPEMQAVYRSIENVADSRATIFITGESGTGKEVAAEAIHRAGNRRDKPFVAVNCGAIPENLLESELFGHIKGAFTGAIDNRPGAARAAHGGTLFLDELCEMELKLQVKLLRFLQTGMVQPVGSNQPQAVDVRVICATNRDPMREVSEGRFREDLFYRLAVIPIHLPPLRERGDDVAQIAQAFLDRFTAEEGKPAGVLGEADRQALRAHHWPGNVRELQNVVRRAVVMGKGPDYELRAMLPASARAVASSPVPVAKPSADENVIPLQDTRGPGDLVIPGNGIIDLSGMTLDAIERVAVEFAIARAEGNLPAAARQLGVSPSTLYRKRERWADEPACG